MITRMLNKLPGWLRRTIIIAVVIAVVGFICVGVAAHFINAKKPPSLREAPWMVQTSSRVYYAREFSIQDDVQQVRGFWYYNGSRWVYDAGVFPFPENIFGRIDIVRRTK